jgi:diguanylate cyclase (GGDEF)-like protein
MNINPIYVANFLLLVCYTVALWLICSTNARLRDMRLLAWAYTAGLCSAIIATIGSVQQHWFVHAFSPGLLLLGFILLHYTFLNFVGRPPRRPWGWLTLLSGGFAGFAYCGMHPQLFQERAILIAALLSFQTGLSAYVLFRYPERAIRVPARTLALVFLMFSARSLGRCLWIVHYHSMPERMDGWWTQISGPAAYLMLNAFTPLGYLWMATTRLQGELEGLSSIDSLTGALNRRAFDERGNAEVERSRRYQLPMSVVAMDVDHFKQLNDSHGHAGGDAVLVGIADAMRSLLRSTDHLGRFGGDEFVLLLPETAMHGARDLAGRLRDRIDGMAIEFQGEPIKVHASFGVATMGTWRVGNVDSDSWEQLLQRADAALYRAKAGGRNRVEAAAETVAAR